MPAVTQSFRAWKPVDEPRSARPDFEHYFDGVVEPGTFEDAAQFLGRAGATAVARAKGLCLWADEVVVLRDARGFVRAAHGFRYLDIENCGITYRLIYTVFSVLDESLGDRSGHLKLLAARIYGRERMRLRGGAILWVTCANYDPGAFPLCEPQPMRPVSFDASSSLPHSLRLHADLETSGPSWRMPVVLEAAIASLMNQRNQAALSAQLGETLLVPCSPSVGDWPAVVAKHD